MKINSIQLGWSCLARVGLEVGTFLALVVKKLEAPEMTRL
jgi:hypothetical protein